MSLSVEQYLLLNNIMYMEPEEGPFPRPESFIMRTVGDWMDGIDESGLQDNPEYLFMTTMKEWRDIINAVKKDPVLCKLKILLIYTDLSEGGGTCKNAVFVLDDKEAVVVFKGTDAYSGMEQWKDNFYSGNLSDSPHQVNALNWYRECYEQCHLDRYEVSVTGHSKGGNKAKYVTILDPTVSSCVSFDGEGFSDKFFDKYSRQISLRKDRIFNHMVNYDYISVLLNDVGSETYYYGNNLGTGGFMENHLPNTFLRFDEDGGMHMDVDLRGRPAEINMFGEFANSFLRSQDDEERSESLRMFSSMLETVLSVNRTMTRNEVAEKILDFAYSPENKNHLAYLAAYIIRYQQRFPEMMGMAVSVLVRFHLESFIQYVDYIAGIVNWKRKILWRSLYAGNLSKTVNKLNRIPDWAYSKLADYLKEKNGLVLSREQIRKTAELIDLVDQNMQNIVIQEDRLDRTVSEEEEIQ